METTKTVWKADATHSSAEFSVRHMMISTVKGRFKDINVEYEGDVDDLTRGVARVEIGTSSVETLDPDRDNHLRSDDFFNSEKFPKMSFVSKKIESVGNSKYKITGDLTVRDVTKE
ncbi:MAG TPA: YceI family protein, partial [Thermoplasmataceae archaeon]|nr:YceI family protein [Thermoplasmataceae archaeon]